MKTEDTAWNLLREHAASRLTPGFAERVLREIRGGHSPLLISHYVMCVATAALCLMAVMLYHAKASGDEATNLAGWNEVAAQANDLDQGL